MMMLEVVSRTARSFPEPATKIILSVTSSRTTPRGAATYPAKMMRPLAVARWPKTTKNRPKNIPYSAKISHLVCTILADIAARVTNLYSEHPVRHSTSLDR
jgi:hypothetical protein